MQWFFARRYLLSRSSHSVINIIAVVSLVSVAIPVAAMIILLSVFNGFEGIVRAMYAQVDADIEITLAAGYDEGIRHSISQTEGVEALSFVIEGEAIASSEKRRTAVKVRGVEDSYFDVLPLNAKQLQGSSQLTLSEIDYAIVTQDVTRLLGIYTTSATFMTLITTGGSQIESFIPLCPINSHRLSVGGIIRDSQQLQQLAIVPFRAATKLFGQGAVKAYIRCSDNSQSVAHALEQMLGEGYTVTTREQKNSLFYAIMRYEKWAIFFVALLVLIIASLSIIGTVIMLIVEKREQQKVLLSMGADNTFIRGIFVREGLLISAIGGVAGALVGIVVVLVQQWGGVIAMPSANFVVDSYPVKLLASDIAIVFITFVAVAWTASQIAANTMIKR